MIKVTRIIVYTFADNESAEVHMANSYVPFNGTKIHPKVTIRSASFVELFNESNEDDS